MVIVQRSDLQSNVVNLRPHTPGSIFDHFVVRNLQVETSRLIFLIFTLTEYIPVPEIPDAPVSVP